MKLSEKRKMAAYNAIREPIMDLRLNYSKGKMLSAEELDERLFRLELQIWLALKSALKIEQRGGVE